MVVKLELDEEKMTTEWNDESPSEAEVIYIRHFHPGLCAKCYKFPSKMVNLKNCAQCQLVSYCSKACQKSDWRGHKSFCIVNAIEDGRNIFSAAVEEVQSKEDWMKFRTTLQIAANVNLGRSLTPYEREVLWGPKVCEVCKNSDLSKLFPCPFCHSIFYCSPEHATEDIDDHVDWCGRYHTCASVDGFEAFRSTCDLPFPINISRCYSDMPKDMTAFLESELSFMKERDALTSVMYNLLISERLTDPLTLLNALENFYIGSKEQKISDVKELVVHVVGAEGMREMLGMIRWEFLAHRLPSLMKLRVVFIGPTVLPAESDPPPDGYIWDDGEMLQCDECEKSNRKFMYEMCHMLYHQYTKKDYFCKPDVMIAFNCGFHEFVGLENNTWPESLALMVSDPRVPLIFTSYTKSEAIKDLQVLENLQKVDVTMPIQLNPYKSLRPVRDFCRDDGCQLFYINQYITCVNGQKI